MKLLGLALSDAGIADSPGVEAGCGLKHPSKGEKYSPNLIHPVLKPGVD